MTVEMLIIIPVDDIDLDRVCKEIADFLTKNFEIGSNVVISAQISKKKVVVVTNGETH